MNSNESENTLFSELPLAFGTKSPIEKDSHSRAGFKSLRIL